MDPKARHRLPQRGWSMLLGNTKNSSREPCQRKKGDQDHGYSKVLAKLGLTECEGKPSAVLRTTRSKKRRAIVHESETRILGRSGTTELQYAESPSDSLRSSSTSGAQNLTTPSKNEVLYLEDSTTKKEAKAFILHSILQELFAQVVKVTPVIQHVFDAV